MKHLKLFENFNESESEFDVNSLFNKYERELQKDTDKYSKAGLKKSLELVGPGEITEKGSYGEKFMYKEMMMDDKIIFVVHGTIGDPVMTMGYEYEIGVYRNDPKYAWKFNQNMIEHTRILNFSTQQKVYQNENILSKVCADIKAEIEKGNIK